MKWFSLNDVTIASLNCNFNIDTSQGTQYVWGKSKQHDQWNALRFLTYN